MVISKQNVKRWVVMLQSLERKHYEDIYNQILTNNSGKQEKMWHVFKQAYKYNYNNLVNRK